VRSILACAEGDIAVARRFATHSKTPTSRALARQDEPIFNYLSAKDRLLIRDAVELECDGFLSMELRLPRNAPHLRREIRLLVVRPIELSALLRPWARLFT
jgi:hypothetical protein